MKNPIKLFLLLPLILLGCASSGPISMQILQKDTSKIYSAVWKGRTYNTGGFIEMNIADKRYRGEPGRVEESNLFGLRSRVGSTSRIASGSSFLTTYYRAILVNDAGLGMRCDFYVDFSSGSGLCVDENQKVFEISLIE